YVNDHLIVESSDRGLPFGKVGLAKFRDTTAMFRNFQVAANLLTASPALSAKAATLLTNALENTGAVPADDFSALGEGERRALQRILYDNAHSMEQHAAALRRTASDLRRAFVQQELTANLQ